MILIDCCELWIFLIFIIVSSSFHNTLCYIGLIPTIRFELIKGDACDRNRTCNFLIKSQLLYQLSYTDAINKSFSTGKYFPNASDRIRTCGIRVKSPLPFRLATDAISYSVYDISVFALSSCFFLLIYTIYYMSQCL